MHGLCFPSRPAALIGLAGLLLTSGSAATGMPGATVDGPAGTWAPTLRVSPLLIAEAAEVWSLIAAEQNPIWPGWNASDTPLLFYLPGEQDVLINHPRPPAGFVPYEGPLRFPSGPILVRDGPTLVEWDGQNTARDINGVPTLVVADPLSNLRLRVRGLLEDPRPAAEKAGTLALSQLAVDPYEQLALVTHEAFHVFQRRAAPDRSANEMLLVHYPVLSVENNVGFALEGAALADALRSRDAALFRRAVLQWLALRGERRSALPAKAVEYEDGVEFGEGLAKYTEYRLFQVLEGRAPGPALGWAQGFSGYGDLESRREDLVAQMVRHMRGEVAVNNDPYGAAPLRMRLYFSGMAIGALLDRLSSGWKQSILTGDSSLTSLMREAVHASAAETRATLAEARRGADHAALVDAKTRLAHEGRARIDSVLGGIERGPGTAIVIDYSALESPRVGMAFTPFGVLVVDPDRIIYTQVPIQVSFPDGAEVAQTQPSPLLHDKKRRLVRFRLPRLLAAVEAPAATPPGGPAAALEQELPGVRLRMPRAVVERTGEELRILLQPKRE